MEDGLRSLLALVGAGALALITVPLARRAALATDFLDHPRDYKNHADAIPYLGGAGVLAAFAVSAAIFGDALSRIPSVLALAALLMLMGTADDRRPLGPGIRFMVQVGAALALWLDGIRWEPFGIVALDLPITLIWVAGLTNAFNLLDNIDGAAATVGAVSAAGIGAVALGAGEGELAAVAWALSGACAAFLVFNLSESRKIFLGDGGSMPIGFLIAALAMLLPAAQPEAAVLAAVPLAAGAIFDTTLVVISRYRRGVGILTGGRDHSTHRLLALLGTPRRVCMLLAVATALLCGLAYAMYQMSEPALLLATGIYVAIGLILLAVFEGVVPASRRVESAA